MISEHSPIHPPVQAPENSLPAPRRWRDVGLLVVIFTVALIIRLVYVFQSRTNPLFDQPVLDSELHDRWARAVAQGTTLFEGPYFRAPLYPWFLGLIYKLCGPGYLAPRIVQAVIGSISCVLVLLIGRDGFGRAVGVLAGLAAATYWVMVYHDGELLLEPLSIFLNLLSLWLMLRAARGPGRWLWLLSGIVMGVSALNRPNVLLFMPAAAAWIVVRFRPAWSRGAARAGLYALGCALPILPVTVRNYVVGKDLVLIAWQGGPNFYIGNNPRSDGYTPEIPGARKDWWGGYYDWVALAEQAEGRKLKPSEVSDWYFKEAWRFIREQPKAAIGLTQRKFLYFWNDGEIPNPVNLYYFARRYGPIVKLLPLSFGMIAPLALVGLGLTRKDAGRLFPLWGFAAIWMATVVAFFVCARFRLPIVPILMLYAAAALVRLWIAVRSREWRIVAISLVVAAVLWPVINTGLPASYLEDAGSHCRVAAALLEEDNVEGALAAYRRSLELKPEYPLAYSGRGELYLSRGRYEEAIQDFDRALRVDPKLSVHGSKAAALVRMGRFAGAVSVLRDGAVATPGNLELQRSLAWLLATAPVSDVRDAREAVSVAEKVVQFGGRVPATLDTLAAAYAEAGRFAEAVEAAQEALTGAIKRGDAATGEAISQRLQEYRAGRPYRESMP